MLKIEMGLETTPPRRASGSKVQLCQPATNWWSGDLKIVIVGIMCVVLMRMMCMICLYVISVRNNIILFVVGKSHFTVRLFFEVQELN